MIYPVVILLVGALMAYKLTTQTRTCSSMCCMTATRWPPTSRTAACAMAIRCAFSNKWSEPRKFALEVSGVNGAIGQERGGRHRCRTGG